MYRRSTTLRFTHIIPVVWALLRTDRWDCRTFYSFLPKTRPKRNRASVTWEVAGLVPTKIPTNPSSTILQCKWIPMLHVSGLCDKR